MRKKVLLMFLAALTSISLAGCSESTTDIETTTEVTESAEDVTDNSEDNEDTESTEQTASTSLSSEDEIKEYILSCDPLLGDYKDILRYEDDYLGKNYFIDVRVVQVLDDGSLRAYFDYDNNDIIDRKSVV